MKKLLVFLLLLFFIVPVNALEVPSKNAILMDMDSGRIIYEKNINDRQLIASITKIMTAVLAIESGRTDEVVTAGEEVLKMYGSSIYLSLNEQMTLKDLLYGLMLRSGNDAAVVIAKFVGGSEEKFVKMMNDKAREIGMTNTTFQNSHGLDEETENYSTAYDMALLSTYANNLPLYREIVKTKNYYIQSSDKSYAWINRNKLLTLYKYATGGKTGYTPRAGHTLVTTASKDNLNLTAVTLNDGDEYNTHKTLYEYAFENYNNYLIIDKNNFKISSDFIKDKVYINENFSYPLTQKEKDKLLIKVIINKVNNYKDKDKIGVVRVILNNETIFETDVFVKVRKINNIWDKILSWFK